jgi:penicillin-binding protein 1A
MADWDDYERGKKRNRREPDFDDEPRPRRRELALEEDDRPAPTRSAKRNRREPDFEHDRQDDDYEDRPRRKPRREAHNDEPEPHMSRRARHDDEAYDEPPRKSRRPARKSRGFFGKVLYWSAVACVWGVIGLAALIGYHAMKLPPIDQLAVPKRPPNVAILAADGTLMANRGETGGSNVPIGELPKYVPRAFVAIEDRRFYDHFGLDVVGLARAAFRNVTSGRVEQGGSTLTQQLAKNLFLTQERTMSRKVQEAILALWLERNYRKDQILELYLNRVYFGSGAYGIEAAAQKYFGKSARLLTLGEAAVLAGLMKSPSRLAPNRNPDGAAERATLVLKEMLEQGFVSEQQAKVALTAPAEARKGVGASSVNYAADWVMDVLDDFVGAIDGDVQVTTTFIMPMQNAAERALGSVISQFGDKQNFEQGAIVAMAPDGAVRALVGGRNYAESQFNRAVLAKRQPGSSFKPFVYLAALEKGMTPETVKEDSPVRIKEWQPENYTREYFGQVTLTRALAMSLNTVAVKLGMEVGPKNVARTAQRLGVNSPLAANASLALGTSEVTPLEITAAYATFANGGTGVAPYVISKVTDMKGKVLYQRKAFDRGRVIEAAHVAMLNQMMRETLVSGTARKADLPGWIAAGKTGTTQDHRDAWFIGYTGALVGAVWLGNDDNDAMKKVTGSGLPVDVWSRFMKTALANLPVQPLPGLHSLAPSSMAAIPLPPAPVGDQQGRPEDIRAPQNVSAQPVAGNRPTAAPAVVRPPGNVGAPTQAQSQAQAPRLLPAPTAQDRERLNQLLSR